MKQKKERAEKYEPLVETDLSFDELLKLSAHTPPPKEVEDTNTKELKNAKRKSKSRIGKS